MEKVDEERKLNYYFIGNDSLINEDIQTSTIEEAYQYLKDKEVISIDIETTRKYGGKYLGEGLNPYLTEIVMFQIGDKNKQFVIDYRTHKLGKLRDILKDESIIKVGQNIKFEYLHIFHNERIRLTNLYDTMVCEKILYNGLNLETSLKALNERYLNIVVDKATRLEFLSIRDRPFTHKQIKYGAEDILYPLLIMEKQLLEVERKRVTNCLSLEMLFIEVLGDIEYKGMHFNRKRWLDTYISNLEKSNEVKKELDNFVIENYQSTIFVNRQLDMFSSGYTCRISWTSSKQVIEFFRYLGICPMETSKTTKKLAYTVNANVLRSSLNTSNKDIDERLKELLGMYLRFKEIEQSCTTFGKDFFKHINPITNRIHSSYNQILNTGRISSKRPNLQNIPSDLAFRWAFDAPEGWKIVNADYSGQEQIILANKSQDRDLINFYEQNLGDMHSFIAAKIFPDIIGDTPLGEIKKKFPEQRQIAKAAGFAINYGGTGFTIAKNLGIPQREGDAVYDAYFKAFPGLHSFFKRQQQDAERNGYILIDPITGRKTWYPPEQDKHKIHKLAQNYPIQGEAGGITKFAAILFRRWILDNDMQDVVFITNLVHDEINVEVKEEFAEETARALEQCMGKAGDKWCKIVPLKAEAAIVDYWTHQEL